MKIAYLDCSYGISGDMLVGALLDLGIPMEKLREELSTLPLEGWSIEAQRVNKNGVIATRFIVEIQQPDKHLKHRHLKEIREIIGSSSLPEMVKQSSIRTFEELARVEAEVHGTSMEKVHFHEVGAIDAIIDIVGVHWCWWYLKIEKAYCSAIEVGGGSVECEHGVLSVPAPAVSLLLRGYKIALGRFNTELTTPTGAVLLKTLGVISESPPLVTLTQIGIGAGSKDIPGHVNALRIFVGDAEEMFDRIPTKDQICVVETNIDDMSGELIAPVLDGLLNAGSKDAFITPIWGKKGRPGFLLTVLCELSLLSRVREILFTQTSTFGLRYRIEPRFVLSRKWVDIETPWGTVQVKVGYCGNQIYQWSPEFETCNQWVKEGKVSLIEIYDFIGRHLKSQTS